MKLTPLPEELDELRQMIISSNLTSCYLILNELAIQKDKSFHYHTFKDEWIGLYKNVYKLISQMKPRGSSREEDLSSVPPWMLNPKDKD